MALQIDRGLGKFDYVDHYAILGVPVDAQGSEIRKCYLKIARSLHPDSCAEANKQLASQLLSKLVNPAYEKLMQDRERTEYEVLLRLLGQRVIQEKDSIELKSERAMQLLQISDPDNFYKTAVREVAQRQYQDLDQTLELTGELSELNLAYLVARESKGEVSLGRKQPLGSSAAGRTSPSAASGAQQQPATPAPSAKGNSAPPPSETFVGQYYRRAEEFLAKNNLQQATLELRDALKLEPSNSRCHALLGTIYLRQNQVTMAKVHINQALKLDPKNSTALTGKQQLDKLEQKSGNTRKQSSGLFGLFGGKKK